MKITNFEFKAKVNEIESYEKELLKLTPQLKGTDHQTDTYFKTKGKRLKLREGNIENALIYYDRENTPDLKASKIILYKHTPDIALKNILSEELDMSLKTNVINILSILNCPKRI